MISTARMRLNNGVGNSLAFVATANDRASQGAAASACTCANTLSKCPDDAVPTTRTPASLSVGPPTAIIPSRARQQAVHARTW